MRGGSLCCSSVLPLLLSKGNNRMGVFHKAAEEELPALDVFTDVTLDARSTEEENSVLQLAYRSHDGKTYGLDLLPSDLLVLLRILRKALPEVREMSDDLAVRNRLSQVYGFCGKDVWNP